jgi:hypothetical protein
MTLRTVRSAIPEVGVVTVAMNTFIEWKKFSLVGRRRVFERLRVRIRLAVRRKWLLAEDGSATATTTTTTTMVWGYGGKGVASRDLKRTP